MRNFNNILNLLTPDDLVHTGFELADRWQTQHILGIFFIALCTLAINANMGQAGIGTIDQAQVSNYCPVPQNTVIAQPQMLFLFLEHHELYPEKCDIPKDDLDYFIPFGKANVLKEGSDVTVVSYSRMISECQKASENLEQQGVSVELIDLRTLSPGDIDYETIGRSFKKTNILVIVEQAPRSLSIGSKIAEQCQVKFFDYLDGPITTISGLDIPNPVSKRLEQYAVPSLDEIQQTIFKAAKRQL